MRLTIYRKMLIGFGIILAGMIVVNGTILARLASVADIVRSILSSDVRAVNTATRLHALLEDEERSAQKYMVLRDATYLTLFRETAAHTAALLDSLAASGGPLPSESVTNARFRHRHLMPAVRDSVAPPTAAELSAVYLDIHRDLDVLVSSRRAAINTSLSELDNETSRLITVAIVLTCCALVGTGAVALVITRSITRPLQMLREGTRRVAEGDFARIQTATRDEIAGLADDFNIMSARLKRSNDQRVEMMHHISHEIRMPLQAMFSAVYLLTEGYRGPLTTEQLKLMESLRGNIDRIADFSNQFLDLARIEAGMMEFNFDTCDLGEIAAAAVDAAQPAAAAAGISIQIEAGDVPAVQGDRDRLSAVVTNFLSNAIKYTGRGGQVTVELAPCEAGVRLSVRDTGVGIDADDLPKIFTKFYQARNAASARQRGTGLGLALVKAIVEQHQGRVSASSTVGEGSVFTAEFAAGFRRQNRNGRDRARSV